MSDNDPTLDAKIRALGTLEQRLKMAQERIGAMCRDGRPPKMSIPVQANELAAANARADAAERELARQNLVLEKAYADMGRLRKIEADSLIDFGLLRNELTASQAELARVRAAISIHNHNLRDMCAAVDCVGYRGRGLTCPTCPAELEINVDDLLSGVSSAAPKSQTQA